MEHASLARVTPITMEGRQMSNVFHVQRAWSQRILKQAAVSFILQYSKTFSPGPSIIYPLDVTRYFSYNLIMNNALVVVWDGTCLTYCTLSTALSSDFD